MTKRKPAEKSKTKHELPSWWSPVTDEMMEDAIAELILWEREEEQKILKKRESSDNTWLKPQSQWPKRFSKNKLKKSINKLSQRDLERA